MSSSHGDDMAGTSATAETKRMHPTSSSLWAQRSLAVARFLASRLFGALSVVFVLSIIVFSMVRLMPGDPVAGFFDTRSQPTQAEIDALKSKLGLDKPACLQYVLWVWGVLHGDFGESLTRPVTVAQTIATRLPYSIELAILSTVVAVTFGVLAGALGGVRQGSPCDHIVRFASSIFISTPTFLIAIVVLLFNSRTIRLRLIGAVPFQTNPWGNLSQMLLPALLLGLGLAALIARHTRAGVIEELERPYIVTLKSLGTPKSTVSGLALRNAMIPVSTVIAIELAGLVGGTVTVEQVFAIPGMGSYLLESIKNNDYPSIQGAILVLGAFYVVLNFIVDIVYPMIDPRIETSSR